MNHDQSALNITSDRKEFLKWKWFHCPRCSFMVYLQSMVFRQIHTKITIYSGILKYTTCNKKNPAHRIQLFENSFYLTG